MIPESKLENYIKGNRELRQLSYRTLIHKHFYENIDERFPYQQLTLEQVEFPHLMYFRSLPNKECIM